MLPRVDKMGGAAGGATLLLQWTSGEKWAATQGRRKVSMFAGQGEEARKREWTEMREGKGGMRADLDSRHSAETCNRTEINRHHW